MAGEELYGLELAGAGVDDLEEAEGLLDAVGDGGVLFLEDGVLDVAEAPIKGPVEVGDAGGDGGADVVEGGAGEMVSPEIGRASCRERV